jgi:hypothetical protein
VQTKSLRDHENDGIENQLDPCPTTNSSAWDPRSVSGAGDPELDGLPNDCDPAPAAFNDNQDADGWQNRIDNCPLAANASGQLDQDIASNQPVPDGGPRSDGIGAACDPNAGSPNGLYRRTAVVYRNCISSSPATDDTDGDGVCENGLAGTIIDPNDGNMDSDADGVGDRTDDCISVANPAPTGVTQTDHDTDGLGDICDPDIDGDGWSNASEVIIGTDRVDPCPENTSDHAWPPDVNNDNFVDVIGDISTVAGEFGKSVGPPPNAPARYDVAPDPPDGVIDVISDITRIAGLFGQSCGVLYGTTTGPP